MKRVASISTFIALYDVINYHIGPQVLQSLVNGESESTWTSLFKKDIKVCKHRSYRLAWVHEKVGNFGLHSCDAQLL